MNSSEIRGSTYFNLSIIMKYKIKLSKIFLYWLVPIFCETYLLHIRLFVGNHSAFSAVFGGLEFSV